MSSPLIIGGQDVVTAGQPIEVIYPGDQTRTVGSVCSLTPQEIAMVIEKAHTGFSTFKKSKIIERSSILSILANRLQAEKETLARLICQEVGKPLKLARLEVDRAVLVCRGYAENLGQSLDETYYVQDRKALLRRVSYGPVFAITPFNFPLNLIIHKLAPTIASGSSFTLKPSSKAPLTALYLGNLAIESGYPYISVLPCQATIVESLLQSGVFKKASFTGSTEVGWALQQAFPTIRWSLELGSNSACIIESVSTGISTIAKRVVEGAFQFSGQSCISLQRLYIQETHYEAVLNALFEAARHLKLGDALNPLVDVGPMISLDAVYRVRNLLREAVEQGANIAFGGSTYNAMTLNPTIVNRTRPQMRLCREELFAPILIAEPYSDFEEALARVNDSDYGLQAGIYTDNALQLDHAFSFVEVGGLLHNDIPSTRLDYLPYGGVKQSGFGREGVLQGLTDYTFSKSLIQHQD
jgi:acyl-CoA reductase-like NAD-dependent aldehyde dehydrogenase